MDFPATWIAPLVRTFFDAQDRWNVLREIVCPTDPDDGDFLAAVEIVEDRQFDAWTAEQVVATALGADVGRSHPLLFVVDRRTLVDDDWPILVGDLRAEPGRTFRASAHWLWAVENNVSTANVDIWEYVERAGREPDGVFRGADGRSDG